MSQKVNSNQIAAIILAAGESSRFGSPKQLLTWGKLNLVNTVIQQALISGLHPVVVVLGANAELIAPTINITDVTLVINQHWSEGQSSSIKAGLSALPKEVSGALFLLADQPQITPNLISSILEKFDQSKSVVVPIIDGRRANPVFFPSDAFEALRHVQGDEGGRAILPQFQAATLEWLDDDMGKDIDTPQDYHRLRARYGLE